jgi:hypothetical protein
MSTMSLTAAATGYSALIAGDARLVEAAQRLRYRAFAGDWLTSYQARSASTIVVARDSCLA